MTEALSDETRLGLIGVLLVEEGEKAVYCSYSVQLQLQVYSYRPTATARAPGYSHSLQLQPTTTAYSYRSTATATGLQLTATVYSYSLKLQPTATGQGYNCSPWPQPPHNSYDPRQRSPGDSPGQTAMWACYSGLSTSTYTKGWQS